MIEHLRAGVTLKPRFEIKGPERVVGLADSYSEGSEESFIRIAALWKSFLTRKHEISHVKKAYALGVCLADHGDIKKGADDTFVYMAGLPVTSVVAVPIGMHLCSIPRRKYAIFTHKGSLDKLPDTINYIWGTWILKNVEHYHHANGPDFELYDDRFDAINQTGEFDICIPVERA